MHSLPVKLGIITNFISTQKSVVERQHVRVGYHNKKTNKFIYATQWIKTTKLVLNHSQNQRLREVQYIGLLACFINCLEHFSHIKINSCWTKTYLLLWALLSEHTDTQLTQNSCKLYRHLNLLVSFSVLETKKIHFFLLSGFMQSINTTEETDIAFHAYDWICGHEKH